MINIIDLFSGGGGLTEGFRNENFNIISHVEMNEQACKTLELRDAFYYLKKKKRLSLYNQYISKKISSETFWCQIPKFVTNKTINESISNETINGIMNEINHLAQNNRINGIIGGPPCQAYSTIGRARNASKKGSDTRIYLYEYYTDFLAYYKPDFFVFENVKGLQSFKDINGDFLLPKIKRAFSNSIGESSYKVDYKIIDASTLGVPQKRERLIIFGYKSILGKKDFFNSLDKYLETPIPVKQLFKDLPFLRAGETNNQYNSKRPAQFVSKWIRSEQCINLTQNTARPNNRNDLEIYKIVALNKQHKENTKYPDLPERLITHRKRHIFVDRFKALDKDKVSHTIVAHIAKDGHYYIHPDIKQNRSITVREAARIQTFPDDFYFENSRTSAFTQIGNAVPPYLAKKISMAVLDSIY